jgi:hypothetical protein
MNLLISLLLASFQTQAMPKLKTVTRERCRTALSRKVPAPPIQAGQVIQILGRPAYEIGQFGAHNFAIVINQERGGIRLPDLVEDYQVSDTIGPRFPAIPLQTSGNCLSMIVAYAAQLMKGIEFVRPVDKLDILAGDNVFQTAWQSNPWLANQLFGPVMESLQVQIQIDLFKRKLSELGFTITDEPKSLDFDEVSQRLKLGEKMILSATIGRGRNRIYDVHNPVWEGIVTPGNWMPNPTAGNQLIFVPYAKAIGTHALLLVEAVEIPDVAKFLVFVDTSGGRPLIAEFSTVNAALRHAYWIK